ncbi:hypothetical protein [Undibacterium sp. Ji49W]|uniref:hypothetical protein n=1 Tax=Undibacterium sp. Ji49W TaxID=3413040 RepID=UPI003BF05993
MQHPQFTHWLDALSIGTMLATLAGWLPSLAALASLIWSCIRILETRTVQDWIARLHKLNRERKK